MERNKNRSRDLSGRNIQKTLPTSEMSSEQKQSKQTNDKSYSFAEIYPDISEKSKTIENGQRSIVFDNNIHFSKKNKNSPFFSQAKGNLSSDGRLSDLNCILSNYSSEKRSISCLHTHVNDQEGEVCYSSVLPETTDYKVMPKKPLSPCQQDVNKLIGRICEERLFPHLLKECSKAGVLPRTKYQKYDIKEHYLKNHRGQRFLLQDKPLLHKLNLNSSYNTVSNYPRTNKYEKTTVNPSQGDLDKVSLSISKKQQRLKNFFHNIQPAQIKMKILPPLVPVRKAFEEIEELRKCRQSCLQTDKSTYSPFICKQKRIEEEEEGGEEEGGEEPNFKSILSFPTKISLRKDASFEFNQADDKKINPSSELQPSNPSICSTQTSQVHLITQPKQTFKFQRNESNMKQAETKNMKNYPEKYPCFSTCTSKSIFVENNRIKTSDSSVKTKLDQYGRFKTQGNNHKEYKMSINQGSNDKLNLPHRNSRNHSYNRGLLDPIKDKYSQNSVSLNQRRRFDSDNSLINKTLQHQKIKSNSEMSNEISSKEKIPYARVRKNQCSYDSQLEMSDSCKIYMRTEADKSSFVSELKKVFSSKRVNDSSVYETDIEMFNNKMTATPFKEYYMPSHYKDRIVAFNIKL